MKTLKHTLAVIFICAISYGMVAFAKWELNPQSWGQDCRVAVITIIGMVLSMYGAYFLIVTEKQKTKSNIFTT